MKKGFYELLNPKLLNENETKRLNEKFRNSKPYPIIQIENFLKKETAEKILKEIKKEKFIEKESDLFKFKQTHDLHYTKNKTLKDFHKAFLSWDFFNFISKMTSKKFNGTLDMAGTLYESTSFLLPHDDKLEGRKIAYIIYLSKGFSEKDGGAFAVYNSKNKKPASVEKKFLPEFNSILFFEVSEISFHEVEENLSEKERYAIGGWLH